MNILQVEPTVINEEYYASGKAERKQHISTTLPLGAPIPDRYTDAELQKEGVIQMRSQPVNATPVVKPAEVPNTK